VKQNTSFERNKAEMRELFLNVKQYWMRKKYIKISGKHDVEVLKVPKSKKNNQRERKERSKEKMVASTRICRFYTMGKCKYGLKCRFLHVDDEEDLFFEDEDDDEEEEKSMTGLTFLSASQNDTNQAEIKEQNDVENENQILDKIGQYINNGITLLLHPTETLITVGANHRQTIRNLFLIFHFDDEIRRAYHDWIKRCKGADIQDFLSYNSSSHVKKLYVLFQGLCIHE